MVAQYFQYVLRSTKDLQKEQRRLSVEIFSTFLHEKSVSGIPFLLLC